MDCFVLNSRHPFRKGGGSIRNIATFSYSGLHSFSSAKMQISAPNSKGSSGPGQLCLRGAQCHGHRVPAAQGTCRTRAGAGWGHWPAVPCCSHPCWQEAGTATSPEKLHLDPRGWREPFCLAPRSNYFSKVDAMFLVVHTNSSALNCKIHIKDTIQDLKRATLIPLD